MESIRFRLEPWLIWNIVSSLGWSVGLLAASALVALTGVGGWPEARLLLIGGLGGGLGGLALRLIAPPHAEHGSRWLLARLAGATAGLLASAVSAALVGGAWGWPLGGALAGSVFGLLQAPRQHPGGFVRLGKAALATAVGWGLAFTVGAALAPSMAPIQVAHAPLVAGLGWAILSMLMVMTLLAISPPRLAREQRVRIIGIP